MLNKVKKWLGIEGVKLELILPETAKEETGRINGKIRFYSMQDQKVTYIKVVMIERYTRGKKQDKLIDEYELGKIELNQAVTVSKEKPLEVEFTLPFQQNKSEMDELEDSNIFMGGLVKLAKSLQGVKSEFFIQAEAKVTGTGLNPFDKKMIDVK